MTDATASSPLLLPPPRGGAPVGIFDSGVGGLSVWREVLRQWPAESTVYLADQAHVPYGPREAGQIRGFAEAIVAWLAGAGCKAVVVACNTASAVALQHLRARFPGLPILGLEPAVKPAAALTRSGVLGVMATPATFAGALYRATTGRHATRVRVVEQVCHGLAELVESGAVDGPVAEAALRGHLQPMLDAGADTLVLGCTHYPFVLEAIRRLAGPGVTVIDPAPAVARHLGRVLAREGLAAPSGPGASHAFFTTASPDAFDAVARRLLNRDVRSVGLAWTGPTAPGGLARLEPAPAAPNAGLPIR